MNEFEDLRGERRSFFCPNKLWKALVKETNDCISVSEYIKQAVIEKMKKEEPEKSDYINTLLIPDNS